MNRQILSFSVFFILLFKAGIVSAQSAIQWAHAYGGTYNDVATDLQPGINGGYVFCGSSLSIDGDVVNPTFGGSDYWVVRMDSSGHILWEYSYGGSDADFAQTIQPAGNGYIIGGNTYSTHGEVTDNHGGYDMWVVRTDTAGLLLWEKTYGSYGDDGANAIKKTTDGNFIIAGYTSSALSGTANFCIIKINDTGNIIWQKKYGGSSTDVPYDIQPAPDGGYIITGLTASDDGDVTFNNGAEDVWVVKINDTGALIWQKTYGGTNLDAGNSIQATKDGGYIVAGYTKSVNGDVTGCHGGQDAWILKIDSVGTLQWQKAYGGTDDDVAAKIVQTADGGYIFDGTTASTDGDVTKPLGNTDYWVVKINDTGAIIWQRTLGGSQADNAAALLRITDSTYLIAGTSRSTNGDVSGNHGSEDCWLVMLDDSTYTTATPLVSNYDPLRVFPTLTRGTIHLVVPDASYLPEISLLNMLGQQTSISTDRNGADFTIAIKDTEPGNYVLKVNYKGAASVYRVVYVH